MSRLARSMPNSTLDFLYSTVSGVLTYLASIWSSSKIRRAPKPTISPLAVRIGHSSLRWNRSIGPRLPSRDSPAASSSLNSKPLRIRCLVNESQPDGAKPQPNLPRRGGVEVALRQILSRGRGLLGLQRGGVELLGRGVGGDQPAAAAAVALHTGAAAAAVGDGVADAVGQHLHGLDEADVFDLLDEGVDVAALAAAEAVEVAVVGAHVERRRLLVVEGAQTLERVGSGAAQLDVVADDVLDADPVADGGDVAIGDAPFAIPAPAHTGHRHSLERAPRSPMPASMRSSRPSV